MNEPKELSKENTPEYILFQKFTSVLDKYNQKGKIKEFLDLTREFIKNLCQHFGKEEVFKYKAYHFLIGSTPLPREPYVDFEGEYSVQNFLDNLEAKLNNEI